MGPASVNEYQLTRKIEEIQGNSNYFVIKGFKK